MKKFKANRDTVRVPVVSEEINGILTRSHPDAQHPFLVWDVSSTGVGLWSPEPLKNGETVSLTIGQPFPLVLTGVVVWTTDNQEGHGFRCGIHVSNGQKKLESLYERFSLIMSNKAASGG